MVTTIWVFEYYSEIIDGQNTIDQACSLFKILTQAYPEHALQLSLSHHSRRSRIKYNCGKTRIDLE